MYNEQLFPLVIATGKAFCNRDKEREFLRNNIHENKHTLVLAPRRYGKTSLVLQVLEENHLPNVTLDFFAITDEHSVFDTLYQGVGSLIAKILPKHKNTLQKLHALFHSFNPTVELSLAGQKIKFQKSPSTSTPHDIMTMLTSLDKLANDEKKHAVLVMDEFQQLISMKLSVAIEGAIRHAVERSKNICYIFSGSTRHLLNKVFDDSERPLYHSCDKLTLDRINQQDYVKFLNAAALNHWKHTPSQEAILQILHLTKRHPYYVNSLCSRIWKLKTIPTVKEVEQIWIKLVEEEKAKMIQFLMALSPNQRAVVIELGKAPSKEPTGQAFLSRVRLPAPSANQCIKVLLERDIIFMDNENVFHILDPVMEATLAQL